MTLQLIRSHRRSGTEHWSLVLYTEPGHVLHTLGKLQIPSGYASLIFLMLRHGCAMARIRLLSEQQPSRGLDGVGIAR